MSKRPVAMTVVAKGGHYSHSIVAGGLLDMSYTTRLTPRTSLIILFDMMPSTS
jgi:hypothetical protein